MSGPPAKLSERSLPRLTVGASRLSKLECFTLSKLDMNFIHQPSVSARFGDYLKDNFSGQWTHFRAAVAFIKRSGVRHVAPILAGFARTRHVEIITGIDHQGTSFEGLQDLLDAVSPKGRIIIFHNRLPFTFHPKIYLFKSPSRGGRHDRLRQPHRGGLFTNYEAGLRILLDLSDARQAAILQSMERVFSNWSDPASGTARILDDTLLNRLATLNLVPSEKLVDSELGGLGQDDEKTQFGGHLLAVCRACRTACSARPIASH